MASRADLEDWALSCEIGGHDGPARCVCAFGPGGAESSFFLVTGGNDRVARVWLVTDEGADGQGAAPGEGLAAVPIGECSEHQGPVLAVIGMGDGVVDGVDVGFLSGSGDGLIRACDLNGAVVRQLAGHSKGVISLKWCPDATGSQDFLVSGSWDGTAKLWDVSAGAVLQTLGGHGNGVTVLPLGFGTLITAATGEKAPAGSNPPYAGCDVQVWHSASATGGDYRRSGPKRSHGGPVRGLAMLSSGAGFLSCGNDGKVVLRAEDGSEVLSVAHPPSAEGFESFVLCCEVCADDALSGDEAGNLLSWGDGAGPIGGEAPRQVLPHAGSIWCIAESPHGDAITACHDGLVRIFTKRSSARAPAAAHAAFLAASEAVHAAQAAALQRAAAPSAAQVANYPPWESRFSQESGGGGVRVFNKDGRAIAAMWDAASGSWVEQGEVTGVSDGGIVNGVPFDHVYPVDVDGADGSTNRLEIGYNDGENVFSAAQRFLDANLLPQYQLQQIADYITQRSGARPPVLGADSAAAPAPQAPQAAAAAVALRHAPLRAFATFAASEKQLENIRGKLGEFSAGAEELSTGEAELLEEGIGVLMDLKRYHARNLPINFHNALRRLLAWPKAKAFPVLDLVRCALLHPSGAAAVANAAGAPEDLLRGVLSLLRAAPFDLAVSVTALKLLSNAFSCAALRPGIAAALPDLAAAALDAAPEDRLGNRGFALAAATFAANAAAMAAGSAGEGAAGAAGVAERVVGIAARVLAAQAPQQRPHADALVRAMLAVATLAAQGPHAEAARAAGADARLGERARAAAAAAGDVPALAEVMEDLGGLGLL